MSDTKVFSFPEGNGYNGGSSILGGWGGGFLGFLLGLLFGNNGLFGGGFGGYGAGGAGFLSNQINNDNGRDLLMQAITSQGEQSRQATQTLSTMLGQDFNLVNTNIQAISTTLNSIANAQGVNALQIINAIQSGNAALASQFATGLCQTQMAIAQQTNVLQQSISGVEASIAAKSAADQLANCQQTYTLTENANRNNLAILAKIDAVEDSRKDREITALTAQVAKLESQNFTAGVVQQAIAPVLGKLSAISNEVDAIKRCQPQTITLPNNQYTAVPTLYANAAADFVASYWANRLSAATTPATDTATT